MDVNERVWLKNYPKDIPNEIDPDQFESLPDFINDCFHTYGDAPAFENMGKSLSFREMDELSYKFAAYLQNVLGLKKGDKAAIQMPNVLQYPIALFGMLKAGVTVINVNPLYTPPEMEHQLKDSEAKLIVIVANFAHNLEKIKANTNIEHVITSQLGDMLGGFKGPFVNFAVKYLKKMVPAYHLPEAVNFKSTLKEGEKYQFIPPDLHGDDIAFLQYTGGTTGVSKGAILTHRNMVANLLQIAVWMLPKLKQSEETVITPLPLYHIFALTVNCLSMLKIGAKNILITNPRDMKGFLKELSKHPFSVITGVNTLFNGMLNHPKFKELNFSTLKITVGGGMAVQKAVAEKWEKITGTPLVEGYGLTETSPVLTCNPIDGSGKLGTIGIPLPSTLLKVIDDDGNEVPLNQPGEICAKGPQVMPGYWKNSEETRNVFMGDWLKTGDIGMCNAEGFFKIVDRKKEMINVSGFNVYPNEIEDVVASHEKVLEVGCVGVPDEKSGEAVKIFVVKKDPSLTADELKTFCKNNLTGYKVPQYIEFREELPKSNVGKILRRKLQEG